MTYGLGLVLVVFLISAANADIAVNQTTVSIRQYVNTTTMYSLNLTNTNENNSETVNIHLTGGEILDLTSDFPKTITVPANSSRIMYYTISIGSKTPKNLSGYLIFYYSGQQNIPMNVEILVAGGMPPIPPTNDTMIISIIAGKIEPNKRAYFWITNANGIAITNAILFVDVGGSDVEEVDIIDGIARFDAPSTVTCPAMVRAVKSGYPTTVKIFDSPQCSASQQQAESGTIKFYSAQYSNSFQQGATTNEIFYVKNYGACATELIGVQYDGTTFTLSGQRVPIRVTGSYAKTLQAGDRTQLSVMIDTTGLALGQYTPTLWIVGEDCKGNEVRDSLPFTITVISGGIVPENKTHDLEITHSIVDKKLKVIIEADDERIENAKVRLYYPDGTRDTEYTDEDGQVQYELTTDGEYKITATKDGYKDADEKKFIYGAIGTTDELSINTTEIKYGSPVIITVYAGQSKISSATVKITLPTGTDETYTTSSDGTVSKIIDIIGDYTIRATKTGYFSATKTFSVALSPITIETTAGTEELGKTITLLIHSDSTSLVNAIVKITKPDNSTTTILTPTDGKTTISLDQIGTYTIMANKTGYISTTKTISIAKKAIVITTEGDLVINKNIIISTKNTDETIIPNVDIGIKLPDNILKTVSTSTSGQVSFLLEQLGTYILTAKKEGYEDKTLTLEIKQAVLTVTPIYYNKALEPVTTAICGGSVASKVTADNVIISGAISQLTFPTGTTPIILVTRADLLQDGTYTITATKEGYSDGTASFTVSCEADLLILPKDVFVDENIYFKFNKAVTDATLQCGDSVSYLTIASDGSFNASAATVSGICTLKWGNKQYSFTVKKKSMVEGLFNIWTLVGIALVIMIVLGLLYMRGKVSMPRRKIEDTFSKEVASM